MKTPHFTSLFSDLNQTPSGYFPSFCTLTRLSHASCKIWEIRLVRTMKQLLIKQLHNRVLHSDRWCLKCVQYLNMILIIDKKKDQKHKFRSSNTHTHTHIGISWNATLLLSL